MYWFVGFSAENLGLVIRGRRAIFCHMKQELAQCYLSNLADIHHHHQNYRLSSAPIDSFRRFLAFQSGRTDPRPRRLSLCLKSRKNFSCLDKPGFARWICATNRRKLRKWSPFILALPAVWRNWQERNAQRRASCSKVHDCNDSVNYCWRGGGVLIVCMCCPLLVWIASPYLYLPATLFHLLFLFTTENHGFLRRPSTMLVFRFLQIQPS